ncbi:MAG: amidase, partial [Anaerolineae bacterium]
GGSPFDIGSDTGGSIRLPAHCCGIAGLKPTSGRVPRTGHAISPIGWLNSLTQLGPMARFVDDLVTLLPIIAGPDWRDAAIVPMPLGDPGAVELRGLRVAVHTDNGIRAAIPPIGEVVTAAAKSLETAGAFVEEVRPPDIEVTLEMLGRLMRGADGGVWVRRILAEVGTNPDDSSLHRYLGMESVAADQMVTQIALWDQFRTEMLTFMEHYDIILCPVNAYPALPHGTFAGENYPGFSYTMTYNLTGWPAAVVRCGTAPDGLPLGVQVVAQPWREENALAVARHLEGEFGGWKRP